MQDHTICYLPWLPDGANGKILFWWRLGAKEIRYNDSRLSMVRYDFFVLLYMQMWSLMCLRSWIWVTWEGEDCSLGRRSFQKGKPLVIKHPSHQVDLQLADCINVAPFCHVIPIAELDEGVVMQLASMGFDIEGCKRAVFHTHNQGRLCYSMASCHGKKKTCIVLLVHVFILVLFRSGTCHAMGAWTHGRSRYVYMSALNSVRGWGCGVASSPGSLRFSMLHTNWGSLGTRLSVVVLFEHFAWWTVWCQKSMWFFFPDFSSPFEPPKPASAGAAGSGGGGGAGPIPSEENITMVMSLGFSKEQAIKALKATVR